MNVRHESRRFTTKNDKSAWLDFSATLAAALVGSFAALFLQPIGWAYAAPFIVVAGIGFMRLYVLQHDLGHYSYFEKKRTNEIVGTLIGPLTQAPFEAMRINHNAHHAFVVDLNHKDNYEVLTYTTNEWPHLPWYSRIGYRLYRNPITLFLIGPVLIFAVFYRFPKNWTKAWRNVMGTNLAICAIYAAVWAVFGWQGVLVYALCCFCMGPIGGLIVFTHHNFEDIHMGRRPGMTYDQATIEGSAYLDFGKLFHILTAHIGLHDIHHLNPNIPSYRLAEARAELIGHLPNSTRVTWADALAGFRWKLYDEESGRMVSFPPIWRSPAMVPAE